MDFKEAFMAKKSPARLACSTPGDPVENQGKDSWRQGHTQLIKYLRSIPEALIPSPAPHKAKLVEHICDPQEVEAEDLRLKGHPWLHRELTASYRRTWLERRGTKDREQSRLSHRAAVNWHPVPVEPE